MATTKKRPAPWDRPTPKKVRDRGTKRLTAAQKKRAAARARRAGRPYPNLVDNMYVAQRTGIKPTKKSATKKSTTKKSAAQRSASRKKATRSAREKDPHGGLTAAGRRAFRQRDGSNLKPGVKKKLSEMSRAEMKRKGSWAVRFYGREELPKLIDADGKPTRFALSARAWGEPVPRTEAAARKIADRGRRLLERARG